MRSIHKEILPYSHKLLNRSTTVNAALWRESKKRYTQESTREWKRTGEREVEKENCFFLINVDCLIPASMVVHEGVLLQMSASKSKHLISIRLSPYFVPFHNLWLETDSFRGGAMKNSCMF